MAPEPYQSHSMETATAKLYNGKLAAGSFSSALVRSWFARSSSSCRWLVGWLVGGWWVMAGWLVGSWLVVGGWSVADWYPPWSLDWLGEVGNHRIFFIVCPSHTHTHHRMHIYLLLAVGICCWANTQIARGRACFIEDQRASVAKPHNQMPTCPPPPTPHTYITSTSSNFAWVV